MSETPKDPPPAAPAAPNVVKKAAPAPADPIETFTVARGRTVYSEVRKGTTWDALRNQDMPVHRPHNPAVGHRSGAPGTVDLPRSEGQRLIALGYLVDPKAEPPIIDDGSNVSQAQASNISAA